MFIPLTLILSREGRELFLSYSISGKHPRPYVRRAGSEFRIQPKGRPAFLLLWITGGLSLIRDVLLAVKTKRLFPVLRQMTDWQQPCSVSPAWISAGRRCWRRESSLAALSSALMAVLLPLRLLQYHL